MEFESIVNTFELQNYTSSLEYGIQIPSIRISKQ